MKLQYIPANDLEITGPIDQLFLEALKTYYAAGGEGYERRTVAARTIRIPAGFEPKPEALAIVGRSFAMLRLMHEDPAFAPMCVIERSDGSLWAYDDGCVVTLYHQLAPLAMVRVVVIGHDPAPVIVD